MFEIGQKVVCIKRHSQKLVLEGEVYTIQGIHFCIKCNYLMLDVGIIDNEYGKSRCVCLHLTPLTKKWWISHELFRPLDDLFNEEIEELMNEIEELCPA